MLIAVSITSVNNALLNWLLQACGDCIVAEAQCSSCATGTGITRQGESRCLRCTVLFET